MCNIVWPRPNEQSNEFNKQIIDNLNFNFCPTANRYNKIQFQSDINTYIRKIKLQAYFIKTEQNLQFRVSCDKKNRTRKDNHHLVKTLTQAFQND